MVAAQASSDDTDCQGQHSDRASGMAETEGHRLGHPFVIHGLMFRDCLGQNCGLHMTPQKRRQATDMTQEAMGIVQNYLDTYLRQQCGALQDPILNAANDLAAMYDESLAIETAC